ncbi:MAG: hypothetical protein HOP19_24110, partial [Acidobacteria bacterium]|nr:hypothetical protein [Acidobacteriota bacterium]
MNRPRKNSAAPNPASQSETARLAALREELNRASLEELNQPPKPIANKGMRGEDLRQRVEEFRRQLQAKCDAWLAQGARRLSIQTIIESVIDDIVRQKMTGKTAVQLAEFPLGELHPFLPRFDWRIKGVVPAVRNQGTCGSCWAHTATAALESNLRIQLANFATNRMCL